MHVKKADPSGIPNWSVRQVFIEKTKKIDLKFQN